ncbi:MAG TPA: rubredoxin [Gammaproteobacteria bacterium]|nr:rubredoxin [Gammaproteobacteria bacterium]
MNPADASARIDDDSRLECRICWYLYDPAVGDELGQIPPGTPFSALPEHWRCPQCDAGREMFLPLEGR